MSNIHTRNPEASSAQGGYGSVSGHVYCADTRLPARLAKVMLRAVSSKTKGGVRGQAIPAVPVAETALDGGFVIHHLPVGDYYLAAEKAGYLSSTSQLSQEELSQPSKETVTSMAKLLIPVTVTANRNATADFEIYRGGSISGTVRFEDGNGSGAAPILLYRIDDLGKWREFKFQPFGSMFPGISTDDRGEYRVSGLPAGTYRVAMRLDESAYATDDALDGYSLSTVQSLVIFANHGINRAEAKITKLAEGEAAVGIDIEIPLSTLHTITGHLVVSGTGQPINAGVITLKSTADGTTILSTAVKAEDGQFHLSFVPEGTFLLEISGARTVKREAGTDNPLTSGDPKETVLHKYKDSSQQLIVTGDLSNLQVEAGPATALTHTD